MPHENLALPYVLGALSPVEHDALTRARLYDRSLEHAITSLEHQMAAELHPGSGSSPPAELWSRIASALADERALLASKRVETFPDGEWATLGPGTAAKRMGGGEAWLLRCDPGLIRRPRTHIVDERFVIVAGDLYVGSRVFTTGDYLFSPAEDEANDFRTVSGCIIVMF